MTKKITEVLLGIQLFLVPAIAHGHAFGLQFTLPLPLHIYLIGAGAALVASFVILGLFSAPAVSEKPRYIHKAFSPKRLSAFATLLKILGIALFALTLVLAFGGNPDTLQNPTPILFWIVFLLGFTYFSALVGGLWRHMNPFKTIAEWVLPKNHTPRFVYPKKLSYTPALLFYFGLIWLELLSFGAGAHPYVLGGVLLGYALVSLYGSALFGIRDWFYYCDFFSVFFRLVGMFAPLHIDTDKIEIVPVGERLINKGVPHIALLFFILFMLSSTVFDGSRETQPWIDVIRSNDFFLNHYSLTSHATLILSPFAFFLFYALAIWLMKLLTRSAATFYSLLLRFAYSLIPIAIAYHFAHYFGLLLYEGQNLIPMLSDPFARGWNLFNTAAYEFNVGIIGAETVWYIMVSAIVVGHIIATYIAHRIALLTFESRANVIISQLPMLVLMVFYTAFGLWILSLPFGTGI